MEDHQPEQQGRIGGANGLELPPGFRFHPSDEEIITSYLRPKVLDHNFTSLAVGDADLNKTEPWELPLIANMGENEWYFFCRNDRKYPTGFRANRATEAGYWKATGKDKEIYRSAATESTLIGMKKTLVFYKGRAPKGVKTNWVMHEYRLPNHRVWAVCRVFHKCSSNNNNNNNNAPELTTPASEPANDDMTMGRDSGVDSRSMSFPVPTKFPMESEDFTMDFSAPFYFADSTSPMLPAPSPMVGMDSMLHKMNTGPFVDTMAPTQPMSFYHQVGIGTSSDCNFMAQPDSKPTLMLPGDGRVSPNQTSAAETSALTTAKPLAATAANIDNIWK